MRWPSSGESEAARPESPGFDDAPAVALKKPENRPGVRRALAVALVAVLLAALAPQAQAAINKPRGFHEDFPYMAGLGNGAMTVVSGKLEATTSTTGASYGFFDSKGAILSGLTQVCYGTTMANAGCTQPGGSYTLTVSPMGRSGGGSFALCFPGASSGTFRAGHALGLFVDFAQDDDLNTFGVDKSLVAPSIDGSFHFGTVPNAPGGPQPCQQAGGLTSLDDVTTVQLRSGSSTVTTLTGKDAVFSFAGKATVSDVAAGFFILPFNGGSEAHFRPASAADAKAGLDLGRVQDLIRKLDRAHAGSSVDRSTSETGGKNTQELLAGLLNGALLRMPEAPSGNESFSLDGSRFARFSSLQVAGSNGKLDWDGKAYLDIDDGKVVGAKPLVGFWLFKLPWWSYLLWAVAIGLAIVRLVLKADKSHPRWDPLRWVGWVLTPVAWIVVFFLWDLEVRNVLGVSLLHGASGQFRLIVGALELGLLGIIGVAAAAPLKVIGRNAFILARQGTFMGISGGVGAILGFLFTAPYLRAYVGLVLAKVMEKLG